MKVEEAAVVDDVVVALKFPALGSSRWKTLLIII